MQWTEFLINQGPVLTGMMKLRPELSWLVYTLMKLSVQSEIDVSTDRTSDCQQKPIMIYP